MINLNNIFYQDADGAQIHFPTLENFVCAQLGEQHKDTISAQLRGLDDLAQPYKKNNELG